MSKAPDCTDPAVHSLQVELRQVKRLVWLGPVVGFATAILMGAALHTPRPVGQNLVLDTLTVRMILVMDPANRPVAMFGSNSVQGVTLGLGGGDQPSVAMSSSPAAAVVATVTGRSRYRAMLSAIAETGVVAVTVQDRSSRLAWGVSQGPREGLVQGMRNQYGDYPTAAVIGLDGAFQYHVQKTALEQAGEALTWASALRDLFQ